MKEHKSILIVEDEGDLVEMIKFQFLAKGYEVHTANDGIEALERLITVTPDLIILDLNMPRMGGIEFYNNICDENGRPKYPVLILTARANTAKLFKELEVNGFLAKPVDIEQLYAEVELIIKRRSRQYDHIHEVFKPKSICIIEDDEEEYKQISKVFTPSGYDVKLFHSGVDAIEEILENPPDLVMAKLSLTDIPGDLIALKLNFIPRTMSVRTLVFIKRDTATHGAVIDKIRYKTGIVYLAEYGHPKELLQVIDEGKHKWM